MAPSRPLKRRKIAPVPHDEGPLFSVSDAKLLTQPKWDAEQDFERIPRKPTNNESNKLPIRDAEGWKEQLNTANLGDEDEDSFLGTDDEEAIEEQGTLDEGETPKVSQREQVLKAKEELARLASLINEEPEEHIGSLKSLAHIAQSPNTTVKQLAIATQCAVYKDIIPGYRIRTLSEEDMKEKVSKEVKKLRSYEQSMIAGYQAYVRQLQSLSKSSKNNRSQESENLSVTAVSCASILILSAPHFNFRGELLRIVIGTLTRSHSTASYQKSIQTVETLFQDDDDGRPSLEAVVILTKMIKAKNYQVHESLLNVFLSLRLLSELSVKASYDRVDKDDTAPKEKKVKGKREFRSKRERKILKERKIVEKEMQEADAMVGHEERDRMQSEMLKLVFATYFRILRARTPQLTGAVLEGLAKYAHLINQDFFSDILEALKELIEKAQSAVAEDEEQEHLEDSLRDPTRESLLCVVTAFALLQGQYGNAAASTLHLDLDFFVNHLYLTLHPVVLDANIELNAKSLHLPDPEEDSSRRRPNVNAKTTTVLLIRSLSSVLLPKAAIRSVPPVRLAAFTKQLMTASLQLPEKSCIAMLGLLAQTTKIHGRQVAALWNTEERRGDGVFDPIRGELDGSNPFASTVWEGEILRHHYSPQARDALKIVERNVREAQ
jgi:nucleolar complex protein 3